MHLATTTTVPPFHCPSVPPCCHVIRRLYHWVPITSGTCHTIPPCHLPPPCRNRVAVKPCATQWHHRATVPPAGHLVHHRTTVPPGAPPFNLVRRHAAKPPCRRAAVPPCRRAGALPTRHIGIPMYTHARDCCQ